LARDHLGLRELGEARLADRAIGAEPLDVQETSSGAKANRTQGGQIAQPFADGEVFGIVDRQLSAQGLPLLVLLFEARALVVCV
jgi:hypothetical protein